jgi:hypothetical protein
VFLVNYAHYTTRFYCEKLGPGWFVSFEGISIISYGKNSFPRERIGFLSEGPTV